MAYSTCLLDKKIKPSIQTYNGRLVSLIHPREADIFIDDIAHALSMLCRFNGHISQFYSVAEHCVEVSYHCGSPVHALYGLLHDASEAYLGDVSTPLKNIIPDYDKLERRFMNLICKKYGVVLTKECKADIHKTDKIMLATEVEELVENKHKNWILSEKPIHLQHSLGLSPDKAKYYFLGRFNQLTNYRYQ